MNLIHLENVRIIQLYTQRSKYRPDKVERSLDLLILSHGLTAMPSDQMDF